MTTIVSEPGGLKAVASRWLGNIWGRRERRVSVYGNRRVHIECRPIDDGPFETFAQELARSLDRLDGVEGYHINGIIDRVVISFRSPLTSPRELLAVVEGVEEHCGVERVDFDAAPDYPGDPEELFQKSAEMLSDVMGAALGMGLKLISRTPSSAEFDLAAFMSFVEDTPKIRRRLERVAGPEAVEFLLGVLNSFIQAVGSGPIGPLVALTHQYATARGSRAREEAWLRFEPHLGPGHSRFATGPPRVGGRPAPIDDGVIERYADEAWYASLGGFIVALADTHQLEPATAPLFGGLPKAARYGRDGYCSELVRVLSEEGMIVLDTGALELLDRVDTLLIDGELLEEAEPVVELLVRSGRRAGLGVVLTETEPEAAERVGARALPVGAGPLGGEIRELQRAGDCVAVLGRYDHEVFATADVGVGIPRIGEPVPWAADVVTTPSVEDAVMLVEAIGRAQKVAEQSVLLSGIGATLGTFLSLQGLRKTNPESIKLAVNAVSLVSLANGVARAIDLERCPRPEPRDPTDWHALNPEEVFERLETGTEGLTMRQVHQRRSAPPETPGEVALLRRAFVEELANPLTPVLAAAASASAVVGSLADAGLVSAVVAFNAAIGGWERYRSDRAVHRLAEDQAVRVTVRREGERRVVDPEDLVRGDLVEFEAGDVVVADCRILEAEELEVDESALTGESVPVRKRAEASFADHVGERDSMLYDGTAIASGRAEAVVVAVGEQTEANRGPVVGLDGAPETGLERRLRELTDITLPVAGTGGGLLTVIGLVRDQDLQVLADVGLGMAVAAVPEGLPLLATVAQLAASRRLSQHGVLVRNPGALEAIGRIDVLCADKTGTLTRGRIRLEAVSDGFDRRRIDGELEAADDRAIIRAALRASPTSAEGEQLHHPTDRAISEGASRLGIEVGGAERSWRRAGELPFHPERGYHAVLGETDEGWVITVKGSPETLIDRCDDIDSGGESRKIDGEIRRRLIAESEAMAEQGLRVLCLAEKSTPRGGRLEEERIEGLTFRGFVGLSDPARPTAASAVERLRRAGIRTLMITGDHPKTAERIGRDVGLPDGDSILTGSEIEAMSDRELADRLPEINVIARVTPSQKGRIVEALQANGRVVAMAGDGANDAAAIRLAEVGIALGGDATRAAREAADIVVLDENIETMVHAVGEGRAMLEAVRDSVAILAGGNFGEIGFTVVGNIFGETPPLNARQLLLVNLMTDIAPSMAIALRSPDEAHLAALLEEDPEDILRHQLDRALGVRAAATAGGAGMAWTVARLLPGGRSRASTVGLLALVGTQLGQTVFLGSPTRETVFAGVGSAAALLGTVLTPGVSQMFGCRPVGPIGLGIAGGATAVATAGAAIAQRLGDASRPDV